MTSHHSLSVDERFYRHVQIAMNDPKHRYYTGIRFEHPPSPEEIRRHWFESGAFLAFENRLETIDPQKWGK